MEAACDARLGFMSRRHQDWLEQARRDLKAARDSASAENYEWACFQAQQSAEKALKALLRFHNIEPKGHTIITLLQHASTFAPPPQGLGSVARELDRHYIQPRYPNGFASGYPAQFYDLSSAGSAIDRAQQILVYVEGHIPALPSS
jgi:HEPN domain-containing protein